MPNKTKYTLNSLNVGESGYVDELLTKGALRRRLMDIGLTEGAHVTCLSSAPSGDPCAYLIRGAVIAIRARDASEVILSQKK